MLLKAYPTIHALGITLRLSQLFQGIDAFTVKQAEITHVFKYLYR